MIIFQGYPHDTTQNLKGGRDTPRIDAYAHSYLYQWLWTYELNYSSFIQMGPQNLLQESRVSWLWTAASLFLINDSSTILHNAFKLAQKKKAGNNGPLSSTFY